MKLLTPKRLLILCVSSTILTVYISLRTITHNNTSSTRSNHKTGSGLNNDSMVTPGSRSGYLVDDPGCRIPNVNAFDPAIKHLIEKIPPVQCPVIHHLLYTDDNVLRINRTSLHAHFPDDLEFCTYQTIQRPEADDNHVTFADEVYFKDDVEITSEFIKTSCFGLRDKDLIYSGYFYFIHEKNDTEKRCERFDNREKLNVIMLGVDSVSRLNFVRHMTLTRKFLIDDLGAIELKGYNKVGDNTFPNLVPMTTGKFIEELDWDEIVNNPFDEYDFIWKDFSNAGYRTLFAEDAPHISIFNYAKSGFHQKPMDYYLRPFSLAIEDHGSLWNTPDCFAGKLETNVVLDYINDFLDKFKQKTYFVYSFITRLTHDNLNKAGVSDESYYKFFKSLQQKGDLNNSVVMFYSDHGMRFGDIRQSYIGKLEERLPFMYLVFPPWFGKKYPKIYRYLKENQNHLTTPFDIYETLKDILELHENLDIDQKSDVNPRGYSLFTQIPSIRTCESAAILPHWCTCHENQPISTSDPVVISAAEDVINIINSKLQIHGDSCSVLQLGAITDAMLLSPNDKILKFKDRHKDGLDRIIDFDSTPTHSSFIDYQIMFRTKPGGGAFEITIRYYDNFNKVGRYELLGDISRINAYGTQANCINHAENRKFCYCKST